MPQSNHYSHQSRSHNDHRRQPPTEKVQATVTIGQRFPLTIRRLGINGEGIGYYKHVITFVKGALPDEVVVAEVTAVHPRYLEANIRSIRKPSPDRLIPVILTLGKSVVLNSNTSTIRPS